MDAKSRIGILLTDWDSGEQIGMIEFTPDGLLGFSLMRQGLHVFALKPVERIQKENGLKEPLNVKYAGTLKEQSELPPDILERKAEFNADVLNRKKPPVNVGGKTIKAAMVHFSERNPKAHQR